MDTSGELLRVVVVSNGNAFSTMMIRPLLEDPAIHVAGVLIVRIPGGRGGPLATLWRLRLLHEPLAVEAARADYRLCHFI